MLKKKIAYSQRVQSAVTLLWKGHERHPFNDSSANQCHKRKEKEREGERGRMAYSTSRQKKSFFLKSRSFIK